MAGRPDQYSLLGAVCLNVMVRLSQVNGPATCVGVDHDAGGYGRGEAQVVGGGHAIDEHAELVAARDGVDDLPIVGAGRLIREAVEA